MFNINTKESKNSYLARTSGFFIIMLLNACTGSTTDSSIMVNEVSPIYRTHPRVSVPFEQRILAK